MLTNHVWCLNHSFMSVLDKESGQLGMNQGIGSMRVILSNKNYF